ncbi:MAG: hypothetical protein ABIP79_09405 [Chitinophagaceae bacterium]
MKRYLTIATIIFIIMSCKSGNTKENSAFNDLNEDTLNQPDQSNYDQSKQTDLNYIGDLSLGMTAKQITNKLGEPVSKSKEELWGADGLQHQDWEYKAKGISLNMTRETATSAMEVFSISITNPCQFKTKKNIGIGSTYDEVMSTYAQEIDTTASDENVITVGSLYGGIIIEFENNKVVSIFVGAAAE